MVPMLLHAPRLMLILAFAGAQVCGGPLRPTPPGRAPVRTYSAKDGLTSLNPVALVQDQEGYLWVGTQSGLYQFDGLRFRKYGLEEGLPATGITALLEGSEGRLWVGTALRGLACLRHGSFTPCGPERGLPAAGIRGLASGADGRLWVASQEGLFTGGEEGRFQPVPGWPGGPALAVAAAQDGSQVWAASARGLHAMAPGGLLRTLVPPDWRGGSGLPALGVDRSGTLWIRTLDRLWSLPVGGTHFAAHGGLLPPVRNPFVGATSAGTLLVNSNEGIHVLRGDGTPRLERFLKADSPYSALQDREGSLWIGSRPLSKVVGGGAFEVFTAADGLPSNLMWGLHRAPDGTLWVGTQNGACRATEAGWEVLPGTLGKNTRALVTTPDGDLWIAQRNGPPLCYSPRSGRLVAHGREAGFLADGAFGLLLDREGALWLPLQGGGLARGRKGRTGWRFETQGDGVPDQETFSIVQDARGRILVAGVQGLSILEDGRWRRLTRRDGLREDALYQVAALPGDRVVVAYREALGATLLRLDGPRVEVVRHLDKGSGLAGDHVYMLGVDAGGRLWLGTGTGASILDGDRIESLTTEDGLAGDDCDAGSFLCEPDGTVWIGSNTGLTRHRPSAAGPRPPVLKSLIRELHASGQPRALGPEDRVVLPRDQNTLEFQFSALTFLNDARVEHQARLKGLEEDWQGLQGRHARYPALRPGSYTFQVRSRWRGGAWGPEASLAVQVLPAWWERTWVKVLAWMVPVVLAAAVLRLRFRMLRRRNAELQARVDEATAEIRTKAEALERVNLRLTQLNEDKNQMLGIVAHDLRNPLLTIQMHAELLAGETDAGEVDQGSREIRRISGDMKEMIRRLLDIAHIEAGELDLQPEPVDPRTLLEQVAEQYHHKAGIKDIALEVEAPEALPPLLADPFYLREVLDNLLSNAVKFTPPGPPTRCVRLVAAPGLLEVRDEGPGFTAEDQARAFTRFTRLSAKPTGGESTTGLGLSIVKTVVEAMGGTVELESAPGAGATFRLRLPLSP